MFHLIPSNRQEHLITMLQAILNEEHKANGADPFAPSTIIVESQGMKHYVNLSLARAGGIAINIQFPLLSRAIYNLCRMVLGEQAIPKESMYKREILVWRILELLNDEDVCARPEMKAAVAYWQTAKNATNAKYQLAKELADVYEQYVQFRPEWIEKWSEGIFENDLPENLQAWQQYIWTLLIKENPQVPVALINKAMANIDKPVNQLPVQLFIFAVNALTPKQLEFFQCIAQKIDIYFFQINPCMEFWGDLQSDRARAKVAINKSISSLQDKESTNALLANLGQQGRNLFNQFQRADIQDITESALFGTAFSNVEFTADTALAEPQISLLHSVQQGMLELSKPDIPLLPDDQSISIHSCHSVIREVQVLHDYLLGLMEADPDIKPHDIIVLCPAVEDYAPFVDSVFRKPFSPTTSDNPRIVCSIADRAPLDADPMIAMFLDLLTLPDNRMVANQLLDYLCLPVIQQSLKLSVSDVEQINEWVTAANIYWGFDAAHKSELLGAEQDAVYTWLWGIERIFKGSMSAPEDLDESLAWLSLVDGHGWAVLGRLQYFLHTLQDIRVELTKPRTAIAWSEYFKVQILPLLFDEFSRNESSYLTLVKGISSVVQAITAAQYNAPISLSIMQEELNNKFSIPDALNQFNTGQVTFSSMVPMRSVPFKVICMLGLNDGVFPRVTQRSSIDLMQYSDPILGDRSRKNEDRYLFLEALVSARQALYISYQGHDQYTNQTREPSLVVFELLTFLEKTYGLTNQVQEHTLQPFNLALFDEHNPISFAKPWLDLQSREISTSNNAFSNNIPEFLTLQDLVKFIKDPISYYVEYNLGFKIDKYSEQRSDIEPFSISNLVTYKLRQSLISIGIETDTSDQSQMGDEFLTPFIKSGDIPPNQIGNKIVRGFSDLDTPSHFESESVSMRFIEAELDYAGQRISLRENLPFNEQNTLYFERRNRPDGQSRVFYLLSHCLLVLAQREGVTSQARFFDVFWDKDKEIAQAISVNLSLTPDDISPDFAQLILQKTIALYMSGIDFGLILEHKAIFKLIDTLAKKKDYAAPTIIDIDELYNKTLNTLIFEEKDKAFNSVFSAEYVVPESQKEILLEWIALFEKLPSLVGKAIVEK
jgi:exodeoxyribonuclease V gamma subunit